MPNSYLIVPVPACVPVPDLARVQVLNVRINFNIPKITYDTTFFSGTGTHAGTGTI